MSNPAIRDSELSMHVHADQAMQALSRDAAPTRVTGRPLSPRTGP
jgi:hypothetical protein